MNVSAAYVLMEVNKNGQQILSVLVHVQMALKRKWRLMVHVIVTVHVPMVVLMSWTCMENVHVDVLVRIVRPQLWEFLAASVHEMFVHHAFMDWSQPGKPVNVNVLIISAFYINSVLTAVMD